ncbi:MAG: ABC transporter permease [Anaerolineae bacterium]|nr:ABC transporter permease [Anaerolineae bacterium]
MGDNQPQERQPQSAKVELTKDSVFVASQWKLMWWKFRKHKPAIAGGIIILLMYGVALFCEVLATYDPVKFNRLYTMTPPQRIRFVDQGRFQLRPFVYGIEGKRDPETTRMIYTTDFERKYPLRLFVHGFSYKLWGLFPGDIHLLGIEDVDGQGTLYLVGTDRMGRDMFSRLAYGARISMSIGLMGVILSFVLGIVIGGFTGYYGGIADVIVQRVIEFIRAIPSIPLWMSLSAALPVSWSPVKVYFGISLILSLIGWTGLARVVRSQFLALREEDFVMAAKLAGASEGRIVFRHLVPAFLSHIIASISLSIPGMILSETSLSFLGLGIRPPALSWGVLLQEAQNLRSVAMSPWVLSPAVIVVLVVLCFNFLGDGLRDAADPYSR